MPTPVPTPRPVTPLRGGTTSAPVPIGAGAAPEAPTSPAPAPAPAPITGPDPVAILDWARTLSAGGFDLLVSARVMRRTADGEPEPKWWAACVLAWNTVSAVRAGDLVRALTCAGKLSAALTAIFGADAETKARAFLEGARAALRPGGAHSPPDGP